MAKKVKIIVTEEDSFKDNVTYKKNVVMSIVSLATQEISGIASISRKSVSAIRSAFSKNINRGIIVDFENNNAKIDVFVNVKDVPLKKGSIPVSPPVAVMVTPLSP